MRLIYLGVALLCAASGFADTITLKSGRVINGTYLGGSPRTVKVEMGDRIETLDVSDIARIEFGGGKASIDDDDRRPALRRSDNNTPPPPPPAVMRPDPVESSRSPVQQGSMELPAGTNFLVRMIDGVDSEVNRVGQTFQASLDEPVRSPGGDVLIPRGADVTVKLVDAKESGKFTGRAELALSLQAVKVNGQMVDINSQTVTQQSGSRGERTAKVAGGTAAVGAIIGAIAGGGKGAAVGAAAGGAAGAGAEVVTKGQRVKIPSETRLTFVLDSAVRI